MLTRLLRHKLSTHTAMTGKRAARQWDLDELIIKRLGGHGRAQVVALLTPGVPLLATSMVIVQARARRPLHL